jgi:predicted permease
VQRLRHAFVVAQIALAFALLAGAGLLAISLRNVAAISPGFAADHVLAGQISVPSRTYPDIAARRVFIARLLAAIEAKPGIGAVGIVTNMPFSGRDLKSATTVKGYAPGPGESVRGHYAFGVAGRYFTALGLPLVAGRSLEPAEIQRGDRVAVVDEDFARRYWPSGSALGKQIFPGPTAGPDAEAFTIVGVSGSPKQTGLTDADATGTVFYPYTSRFDTDLYIVARSMAAPEPLAASLRQAIRDVDPDLAVSDLRSMDARIADTLVVRRSPALLAAAFSVLALLLTAIGTYGVVGYAVASRRREIALRAALGASPRQVRRHFVSLSVRLVAAGCVLGLAGAWIAGRAMQALLFGVAPLHVPTLAGVAVVMCALTLTASAVPARRAAGISPLEALNDAG